MRIRIDILLIVLSLSIFGVALANAQEVSDKAQAEPRFNAWSRLSNGLHVAFANRTEPPGAIQFALSLLQTEGKEVIHRVFVDKESGLFFGYDVKVEPVPNSRQIKVSIMPLCAEYEQRLRQRAAFRTRGVDPNFESPSLFQTQAAQLLNDGDMLAIDALVNQRTGVRIVEIIKVSFEEIPLGGSTTRTDTGPPRDFTLDDVELKVINYRLLVNGEMVAGYGPSGGCAGAVIWFYMPERGRFIFSLRPHEGYDFQRIGVIENNKILFTIGGEQYQWISSSPVVGVNGRFNLWVLHDAEYRPEFDRQAPSFMGLRNRIKQPRSNIGGGARTALLVGASDRIEYVLPKR